MNVVISGGNTMYRDFKVNLEDKFRSVLAAKHPSARGRVVAPTERLYSPLDWRQYFRIAKSFF